VLLLLLLLLLALKVVAQLAVALLLALLVLRAALVSTGRLLLSDRSTEGGSCGHSSFSKSISACRNPTLMSIDGLAAFVMSSATLSFRPVCIKYCTTAVVERDLPRKQCTSTAPPDVRLAWMNAFIASKWSFCAQQAHAREGERETRSRGQHNANAQRTHTHT